MKNSSFIKDHDNFKKILREVGIITNHYTSESDHIEIYTTALSHYIDPRIVVGFCMKNSEILPFLTLLTKNIKIHYDNARPLN